MKLHLHAKFRFMFFDLGTVEHSWYLSEIIGPLPIQVPPKVLFNDRGVLLEIL